MCEAVDCGPLMELTGSNGFVSISAHKCKMIKGGHFPPKGMTVAQVEKLTELSDNIDRFCQNI